jgi:hypothetical protein
MKWELGALKILAKNPTVPGVALKDAVDEIERLRDENVRLRDALKPFADIGDSFDPSDDPGAVWVDCARARSDIIGLTLRNFFDASKVMKARMK